MHSLFDFGLDGDLSLPEITILVRTALIACAKVPRFTVLRVCYTNAHRAVGQTPHEQDG